MKRLTLEDLKKDYPEVYGFVTSHDMAGLENKRYDMENGVYVAISSYTTAAFTDKEYEAHREYLDIQLVIAGRENIKVEPIEALSVSVEYNPEKDVIFYGNQKDNQYVPGCDNVMEAGDMLLLDLADGHMPGLHPDCVGGAVSGQACEIKKAVFKVPAGK